MNGLTPKKRAGSARCCAAFGPAGSVFARALPVVLVVVPIFSAAGCSSRASTVQVPMLAASDPVFDAGGPWSADGGEGSKDGGGPELEPKLPGHALACRRDVACRAPLANVAPSAGSAVSPGSAAGAQHLPAPFDRCSLHDDKGRAFSARETRDARVVDPARCCYVAFIDCLGGESR